jgi:DNA-binding transcriptional ArsR family regulator
MFAPHAGAVTEKLCEVDLAAVGVLFGDPARAAMLVALSDGRALPAGELARRASVSPATATTHLRRLVDAGLVRVTVQGRHRYHQLAGPPVSAVLEALANVAPALPVKSLRQHREVTALAEARTCYDHLAGRRGVQLRARLLAAGALQTTDGRDHSLTGHGEALIADLDIDLDQLRAGRRIFARSCLDWTPTPSPPRRCPARRSDQHVSRARMARAQRRTRAACHSGLRPEARPMARRHLIADNSPRLRQLARQPAAASTRTS